MKKTNGSTPWTLAVLLLLTAGVCAFATGCRVKPNWKAKSTSPDGRIIATAQTYENGGVGANFVVTTVDLNFSADSRSPIGSQSPLEVLAFSDNPNESQAMRANNVQMIWLSPAQLELVYNGAWPPLFQATLYHGVEITVKDTANQAAGTSQQ